MPFTSVSLYQFRNIQNQDLSLAGGQVFFRGENGQGKSNLLEALYLLCYGRSFRTHVDQQLIRHGHSEMSVRAEYIDTRHDAVHRISVKIEQGQKRIELDGKVIKDRSLLVEQLPCVVFCHDDLRYVQGSPEDKRSFFDQVGSLLFPSYLAVYREFYRALKTRNALLKDADLAVLKALNTGFVQAGMELVKERERIAGLFRDQNSDLYEKISAGISGLNLEYKSSWQGMERNDILAKLEQRQDQELIMKTSLWGPQRDRFVFSRDSKDFCLSASTGQLRLLSLILRLIQSILMKRILARPPILLLDDVLLELDQEKRKRFLLEIPESDQAFFTFLPDDHTFELSAGKGLEYRVHEGVFYA